jgi:hypothetical protein
MSNVMQMGANLVIGSSFGIDNTTLGPDFRARTLIDSERYKVLDRKATYYSCTQHDFKKHDFDGRAIPEGNPLLGQPNLASVQADWYVPLRSRRPSAPYRLARVIVDSFTNLVFGYQRWPTIRVPGDSDAEEFVRALVDESGLRTLMIRARTIGGSTGSVGLSWRFFAGKPVVQAHQPRSIYIHEWEDQDRLIPAHVIEIYKFSRNEWDPQKQKFVVNWYWFRRDWTLKADITYKEVRFDQAVDPEWQIDEEASHVHNDGFCHFVWIQNLPTENPESIDGNADYEGLYENFDSIDLLHSTLIRGTTLNLDPTLVLKLDPDIIERTGLRKGTDNALVVGQAGDAHYMELQGSSVQVGTQLFAKMRESTLEVAQCVVPDPNQIGAAGTSSVALKVVYAPMLGKADILREQYERGLLDLLTQMLKSARNANSNPVIREGENGEIVEERYVLDLPPRLERQDVLDDEGNPTGEKEDAFVDQTPGESNRITFDWGDYFLPTAQDQQQTATTLSQLVAGGLLSQESGADLASRVVRIDPRAEWDRIQREQKEKASQQSSMFGGDMGGAPLGGDMGGAPEGAGFGIKGGMGGRVGAEDELPPGAEPRKAGAKALRVNEVRAMLGEPLLEGEEGDLTLEEYRHRKGIA